MDVYALKLFKGPDVAFTHVEPPALADVAFENGWAGLAINPAGPAGGLLDSKELKFLARRMSPTALTQSVTPGCVIRDSITRERLQGEM
ncbi:MAG: hypothetical protein BGO01_00335 [Armatimonadetes bacterium 55-13]|nr:MAG: hypothetical protein BGO01_00335 [Armatimonadetes bacterium 55-13]